MSVSIWGVREAKLLVLVSRRVDSHGWGCGRDHVALLAGPDEASLSSDTQEHAESLICDVNYRPNPCVHPQLHLTLCGDWKLEFFLTLSSISDLNSVAKSDRNQHEALCSFLKAALLFSRNTNVFECRWSPEPYFGKHGLCSMTPSANL